MNIEISDEDYTTYFKYAHWNMEHLFIKYHYTAKESLLYPQIGKDMLVFLCNTHVHDKRLSGNRVDLPCCGRLSSCGRQKETACLLCHDDNVYIWDDSEFINEIRNPQPKYFKQMDPMGKLRLKG